MNTKPLNRAVILFLRVAGGRVIPANVVSEMIMDMDKTSMAEVLEMVQFETQRLHDKEFGEVRLSFVNEEAV